MHADEWQTILPMVQLAINNCERKSIGGYSAMEIMTGVARKDQLETFLIKEKEITEVDEEAFKQTLQHGVEEYITNKEAEQNSFREIVTKERSSTRKINDQQNEKKRGFTPINIIESDFVLIATPNAKYGNGKLTSRWNGPYKVTRIKNEYIIYVAKIGETTELKVHISRIRKYSNILNNTDEELKLQFTYYQDNLFVEEIMDHRTTNNTLELLVRWERFTEDTDSWEPGPYINTVASLIVENYLNSINPAEKLRISNYLPTIP